MKEWFRRMGFRKMDEMERMVALKAQRNALLYGVVFLLGWSIYNSIQAMAAGSRADLTPSFLLVTMSLVLTFSQVYYQKRLLAGTEEEKEYSRFFWHTLLWGLVVMAVLMAVGAAAIVWWAR